MAEKRASPAGKAKKKQSKAKKDVKAKKKASKAKKAGKGSRVKKKTGQRTLTFTGTKAQFIRKFGGQGRGFWEEIGVASAAKKDQWKVAGEVFESQGSHP
eukprot:gene11414-3680_t